MVDNDQELFELGKRAHAYFLGRYNSREDAKDFATYAVIKWIEGRKASLKFLYIDFLRETLGKNRRKIHKYLSVEEIENFPDESEKEEIYNKWFDDITGADRIVMILRVKYGFQLTEIADCFGVSAPRIKVRIDRAMERIKTSRRPTRPKISSSLLKEPL